MGRKNAIWQDFSKFKTGGVEYGKLYTASDFFTLLLINAYIHHLKVGGGIMLMLSHTTYFNESEFYKNLQLHNFDRYRVRISFFFVDYFSPEMLA